MPFAGCLPPITPQCVAHGQLGVGALAGRFYLCPTTLVPRSKGRGVGGGVWRAPVELTGAGCWVCIRCQSQTHGPRGETRKGLWSGAVIRCLFGLIDRLRVGWKGVLLRRLWWPCVSFPVAVFACRLPHNGLGPQSPAGWGSLVHWVGYIGVRWESHLPVHSSLLPAGAGQGVQKAIP